MPTHHHQSLAISTAVTAVVHVAHAGLVIGGLVVVLVMLSPLAIRRRRAAIAELREAAASGDLVRLAELRAAGHWRTDHAVDRRRPALVVAAFGSLIAAGVHVWVCPQHFHEGLRFGIFFVCASLWQTGWAVLVIRRASELLFRAGIIVNIGMLVLWTLTRTVGLPFGLAEVEPVGSLDLLATVGEVLTIVSSLLCSEWSAQLRPSTLTAERRA